MTLRRHTCYPWLIRFWKFSNIINYIYLYFWFVSMLCLNIVMQYNLRPIILIRSDIGFSYAMDSRYIRRAVQPLNYEDRW